MVSYFHSSGLEKDGDYIKFSGYSGEPTLSPGEERHSRFRKRQQQPLTLVSDQVVGENQRRGIFSKV